MQWNAFQVTNQDLGCHKKIENISLLHMENSLGVENVIFQEAKSHEILFQGYICHTEFRDKTVPETQD